MSKFSVPGLGAMGARMAAHLIKAGHDVTVCNRKQTRRSRWLPISDQ